MPKPFPAYYPAVISQNEIEEAVNMLGDNHPDGGTRHVVGPPRTTEALAPRQSYETANSVPLSTFGPTTTQPLGDIVLARSGDKGANINIGLFVQTAEQWEWFRSFMTKDSLRALMGKDWRESYFVERVEFSQIFAVHFVIYGPLGRGVSSSKLLDSLGKGFAEFIRAVHVPIPVRFLQSADGL